MDYEHITTDAQLDRLGQRLATVGRIALDTEFVSEFTYRPDLCLIQVEYDGQLAVIDAHAVGDVSGFWHQLIAGGQEIMVHAGREEHRFCTAATGRGPEKWFDVQLAAGMVGYDYPSSYGKLLSKILNTSLSKQETRTDWRRRPLTQGQMEYALQDVIYLPRLRDALAADLGRRGRSDWFALETESWKQAVQDSDQRERWRRISGASGLRPQALQIVRELWRWRESEAERRDCPPRRVLRDDLVVELARRGRADEKHVRAIRGIQRRDLKDHYQGICAAIARGLQAPPDSRPRNSRRDYPTQIHLLGQFLGTALTSICRSQSIAVGLVGTVQDVRDLIAHHLGYAKTEETPALKTGWRAEIVGQKIERLLSGELSLRIVDPHSEAPLAFEDAGQDP